jgi:hypothetical protein
VPVYDQWLSVFLRQHDGYYALGDGWIGRIKGMHRQSGIVIIDLEKIVWLSISNEPRCSPEIERDCSSLALAQIGAHLTGQLS